MKSNLVIIGENEKINKSVGEIIAPMLELNYLDFDGYCEYLTMADKNTIISDFGVRKFKQIQDKNIPKLVDFCNSVIGFDGSLANARKVHKYLKNTSIIVCIASRANEKYKCFTDVWINLGRKSKNAIVNEILDKLGDM